jgi:hypothetical protein
VGKKGSVRGHKPSNVSPDWGKRCDATVLHGSKQSLERPVTLLSLTSKSSDCDNRSLRHYCGEKRKCKRRKSEECETLILHKPSNVSPDWGKRCDATVLHGSKQSLERPVLTSKSSDCDNRSLRHYCGEKRKCKRRKSEECEKCRHTLILHKPSNVSPDWGKRCDATVLHGSKQSLERWACAILVYVGDFRIYMYINLK